MAFGIGRSEGPKFTGPVLATESFVVLVDDEEYIVKRGVRYPARHPAAQANPSYFVLAPETTAEEPLALEEASRAFWALEEKRHAAREALRAKPVPPPLADENAVIAIRRVIFRGPDGNGLIATPGDRLPASSPLVKKDPSAFVPVTNGVSRERAMRAMAPMTNTGRKRETRTVVAGQWVDKSDPLVALHPTHFEKVLP